MGRRGKKSKSQKLIIFLSILLAFNLAALAITFLHDKLTKSAVSTVKVPDNYISPENEADNLKYLSKNRTLSTSDTVRKRNGNIDISLYKDHQEDNTPFHMGNMFPGDSETRYFKVKVFYKNQVTVHYRADIRSGDGNLADELKMKVVMYQDGKEMYNGSVGNMPDSLTYQLYSEKSTSSDLDYEITAYLDTSAGNEFQNKDLAVDFRWWVEETNNLEPAVKTGDQLKLVFGILAVSVSGILILLIMMKKHKGEKGYG